MLIEAPKADILSVLRNSRINRDYLTGEINQRARLNFPGFIGRIGLNYIIQISMYPETDPLRYCPA